MANTSQTNGTLEVSHHETVKVPARIQNKISPQCQRRTESEKQMHCAVADLVGARLPDPKLRRGSASKIIN